MTPQDASTFAREICGHGAGDPGARGARRRPRRAARRGAGRRRPAGARGDAAHPGGARRDPRHGRRSPGGVVGAGTLLTPADVRAAKAAGARFGVSPGVTDELRRRLRGRGPAAARRRRHRRRGDAHARARLRRSPSSSPPRRTAARRRSKAFAGPLPQVSFCPTGGVTPQNAPTYLALPNVLCVGGSWVADDDAHEGGRVVRDRDAGARRQPAEGVAAWPTTIWRQLDGGRRGGARPAHPDALRAQPRPVPRVLGPARRHAARLLQD